jgi:hypothetical protein
MVTNRWRRWYGESPIIDGKKKRLVQKIVWCSKEIKGECWMENAFHLFYAFLKPNLDQLKAVAITCTSIDPQNLSMNGKHSSSSICSHLFRARCNFCSPSQLALHALFNMSESTVDNCNKTWKGHGMPMQVHVQSKVLNELNTTAKF